VSGSELQGFARMVTGTLVRRGMPRHLDEDAHQEAALATLETERRYGMPLKGNRTYYGRAAFTETALALARQRAAVSLSEHAAKRAEEFSVRVQVEDHGLRRPNKVQRQLVASDAADESLRADEEARARMRVLDALEDHLAAMSPAQRRALKVLLGIGTEALDVEEASARLGVHRNTLACWVRQLAAKVRQDKWAVRARRLHRELVAS
jgi:hypothetical protein